MVCWTPTHAVNLVPPKCYKMLINWATLSKRAKLLLRFLFIPQFSVPCGTVLPLTGQYQHCRTLDHSQQQAQPLAQSAAFGLHSTFEFNIKYRVNETYRLKIKVRYKLSTYVLLEQPSAVGRTSFSFASSVSLMWNGWTVSDAVSTYQAGTSKKVTGKSVDLILK